MHNTPLQRKSCDAAQLRVCGLAELAQASQQISQGKLFPVDKKQVENKRCLICNKAFL